MSGESHATYTEDVMEITWRKTQEEFSARTFVCGRLQSLVTPRHLQSGLLSASALNRFRCD